MAVLDGLREYRRIHCGESDVEKRRRFAEFKAEVEAAEQERRLKAWEEGAAERPIGPGAGRPGAASGTGRPPGGGQPRPVLRRR